MVRGSSSHFVDVGNISLERDLENGCGLRGCKGLVVAGYGLVLKIVS